MEFTNKDVVELRKKTNAGIMDCKEALTNSNGDMEKAIIYLRKKGLADISMRGQKIAQEGIVYSYIHPGNKLGTLIHIACETDFCSKSEVFIQFAKDIAMQVAAANPQFIESAEVPLSIKNREMEIIAPTLQGKPPEIVEKIVAGKMEKVYKEICLMDQPFVKDPDMTVADLLGSLCAKVGEKVVIKRFVRFITGE